MRTRKRLILGMLASILLAPVCSAQIPGVPAAPTVPGTPAVPTAPSPPNLWSFLCPNADQKAACKACFCNSPIGQMVSGMAGPMSMMSGGMIQNRCAQNAINMDLAKDATSSEGSAAARIKKDEADAKARRAAVRYLGTVDCNYWPEAVDALSLSLRKDPNECVRFEAALSLGHGCCCQPKTVKALEICVEGSDKDGAPKERSDRVRAAAAAALARCPMLQEIEKKKDGEIKKAQAIDIKDYYAKVTTADREQIVISARGVLASLNRVGSNPGSPGSGSIRPIQQRSGSLSGIMAHAFAGDAVAPPASRQPFFTGLTNTLKGRHDDMLPTHWEPPTAPTQIATPAPLPPGLGNPEIKPAVTVEVAPPTLPVNFRPLPAPTPVRESDPAKRGILMELVPATPAQSGAQLGRPNTQSAAPLEIIQPRPITVPATTGPRVSLGVVTVEGEITPVPVLPPVVMPPR